MSHATQTRETIDKTVREEWGRILASLTKTLGDLQLAEDCLQDAVESALHHWGKNGMPNSPAAWLIQTARRKAIDRLRRSKNFKNKEAEIIHLMELDAALLKDQDEMEGGQIPDERLEMIFTCCHPAIEEKSRIALTLRAIGGLTTEEIASSFLDKTETMAARLTRAKKKIALAGIPYGIPEKEALPERLQSVMSVIYLIFNEGYSASRGKDLIRHDLCAEALRLVKLVEQLMPNEPEVSGLYALILLHESRKNARLDENGGFIALENQDRSKWDKTKILRGTDILKSALKQGKIGPYQLQAAISAIHAETLDWRTTDWAQIDALYELLHSIQPSPIIRLNQIYAMSHSRSLDEASEALEELSNDLDSYQPFHALRADLFKRVGDVASAKKSLERAIELSDNESEKEHMMKKLWEIDLH